MHTHSCLTLQSHYSIGHTYTFVEVHFRINVAKCKQNVCLSGVHYSLLPHYSRQACICRFMFLHQCVPVTKCIRLFIKFTIMLTKCEIVCYSSLCEDGQGDEWVPNMTSNQKTFFLTREVKPCSRASALLFRSLFLASYCLL